MLTTTHLCNANLGRTGDYFAIMTWSYIEITVGIMVACLPGARLFVGRYVSGIQATNSKLSSLSRSGNRIRLTQSGENDESTAPPLAGRGSGPIIKFPGNCQRLPPSSRSAREDEESQIELNIMTIEGESKGDKTIP